MSIVLNTPEEMWKGLSNIPIALLALICAVLLLCRKGVKNEWIAVCFLGTFCSIMGITVHTFLIDKPLIQFLWMFLYILLFELTRIFSHRLVCFIANNDEKEKIPVIIIEAVLYAAAAVLLFVWNGKDIFMLVVFAFLEILRIVVCLIKHPKAPLSVKLLLADMALSMVFLALEDFIPYAVVFCHLLIAAALFIYYVIAIKDK